MRLKKYFLLLAAALIFTTSSVFAYEPYSSYIYDYKGNPVTAPSAYVPSKVMDGHTLGIGNFNTPMDVFVSSNKQIYIADSGNNRIVIMDEHLNLLKVISKFNNKGVEDGLNHPQGLFVTPERDLYIADTENGRIVHLNSDGLLVRIIGAPVGDIIPADFKYRPTALIVDKSKRIYVIASGVNKGIIELDSDGVFKGYMGASKVTPNMLDYFWKSISTEEQRSRMELFIPTEYNNIALDEEGFIYVTTSTLDSKAIDHAINSNDKEARERGAPVRKLNPTGDDVLRRLGSFPPVGDICIDKDKAEMIPSQLIDVCIGEDGIYSVLDTKRGRVFIYDNDSNFLSVFGGIGSWKGAFKNPSAFAYLNGNYVVLDSGLGQITIFEQTEYGKLVKDAVTLHQQGKYDDSAAKWREVLDYNANSELACIGMGKAYLRKNNYPEAIKNFKLGYKKEYYSKSFKLYRKEIVGHYFSFIMAGIMVSIFGAWLVGRRKIRKEVGA